ncbi:MAG: hypothetical protein QNJ85_04970 [Gammaproteobacteria bacterium]|nr:hypothetical protein [Gammaproteobacteria bacterium]
MADYKATLDLPDTEFSLPAKPARCARYRRHRADVGQPAEYPAACGRRAEHVDGDGESRHFA